MKPIDFKESTKVLARPATMNDEECGSLPVWSDGKQCVSCWKPSLAERLRILLGGNIWLGVLYGRTQPPVFVTAESVFAKTTKRGAIGDFLSKAGGNIVWVAKSLAGGFRQADKRKHLIVGFAISFLIGILCPLLGFSLGCIAGAVKEWWDSKGHGTVELLDFIFTCLGSLLALPLSFIVHSLIW